MQARRAAIVGAGIGGLAAALRLARLGWEVSVHERAAELGEVGAGLQVGPNGMKVLDGLGVATEVLAHGARPDRVALCNGRSGRVVATVPMGATVAARHGAAYVQIHRADLAGILGRAVTQQGVEIALGSEVEDPETLDADVVVAADGVRSGLRQRLVPGAVAEFTGQVAWRALVPAGALPDPDLGARVSVYMGPGAHLVAYRLRQGSLWNLVAVEERDDWTAEGWSHPGDVDALRARFAGWARPVEPLLGAVEAPLVWGLFSHPELPRWSDGRVVLLGDACHPMLPFLAQGAGMAIEDAWVLGRCLDRGDGIPAALLAYEAARKPRTTRVQRASQRNAVVYHQRNPLVRAALHLGLGAVSGVAPGRLLAGFDWLYGEDVTADPG